MLRKKEFRRGPWPVLRLDPAISRETQEDKNLQPIVRWNEAIFISTAEFMLIRVRYGKM
jgi:hypothetical protein